jgi:RimJ/RimL family protein N-acetyltransferase
MNASSPTISTQTPGSDPSVGSETDARGPETDAQHPSTPVVQRALHTSRLVLRPASTKDVHATWAYRQADDVNEWLSGRPDDEDSYRELFTHPTHLDPDLASRPANRSIQAAPSAGMVPLG